MGVIPVSKGLKCNKYALHTSRLLDFTSRFLWNLVFVVILVFVVFKSLSSFCFLWAWLLLDSIGFRGVAYFSASLMPRNNCSLWSMLLRQQFAIKLVTHHLLLLKWNYHFALSVFVLAETAYTRTKLFNWESWDGY